MKMLASDCKYMQLHRKLERTQRILPSIPLYDSQVMCRRSSLPLAARHFKRVHDSAHITLQLLDLLIHSLPQIGWLPCIHGLLVPHLCVTLCVSGTRV